MIKVFQKVSAGLLLSLGFLFLMVSAAELSQKKRDSDAIWGCLALGVPLLAGGGWMVRGLSQQHQQLLQAQKKQEEDRLNSIFFQLIQEDRGRVTTLRMAMAANLSGEEARAYLDGKAKEFEASFEVGDQGEVFYLFHP